MGVPKLLGHHPAAVCVKQVEERRSGSQKKGGTNMWFTRSRRSDRAEVNVFHFVSSEVRQAVEASCELLGMAGSRS
jgi:hypothetical protein